MAYNEQLEKRINSAWGGYFQLMYASIYNRKRCLAVSPFFIKAK